MQQGSRKIAGDTQILLFKEMLQWAGYRDQEAYRALATGFQVVGELLRELVDPPPPQFVRAQGLEKLAVLAGKKPEAGARVAADREAAAKRAAREESESC